MINNSKITTTQKETANRTYKMVLEIFTKETYDMSHEETTAEYFGATDMDFYSQKTNDGFQGCVANGSHTIISTQNINSFRSY